MTTSRGILLEKLFQIGSLECTISHDIEALNFLEADLNEQRDAASIANDEWDQNLIKITNDKLIKISDEIERRIDIIRRTVALRRDIMSTLEELSDRDWCSCKHYAEAVSRALEIYVATFSEKDYQILTTTYEIWASRLSLYFNLPYTQCFRCLSDKLSEKNT